MEAARSVRNRNGLCEPVHYHAFWEGPVHYQLLLFIKSFAATQNTNASLWLWSTNDTPLDEEPLLAPLARHGVFKFKRYDAYGECEAADVNGLSIVSGIKDDKRAFRLHPPHPPPPHTQRHTPSLPSPHPQIGQTGTCSGW